MFKQINLLFLGLLAFTPFIHTMQEERERVYYFRLVDDKNHLVSLRSQDLRFFGTLQNLIDDCKEQEDIVEEAFPIQHITRDLFNEMELAIVCKPEMLERSIFQGAQELAKDADNQEEFLDSYLVNLANSANFLDCEIVVNACIANLQKNLTESVDDLSYLSKRLELLKLNSDLLPLLSKCIIDSHQIREKLTSHTKFCLSKTLSSPHAPTALALSGNGNVVAWAYGKTIQLFDLESDIQIVIDNNKTAIKFLALDHNGELLAIASDVNLKLYSIKENKYIKKRTFNVVISAITLSNKFLILGFESGYILICDLEKNNEHMVTNAHHDQPVSYVALAQEGKIFASSSQKSGDKLGEGLVRIWELPSYHLKDVFNMSGYYTLGNVAMTSSGNKIILTEYSAKKVRWYTFVWLVDSKSYNNTIEQLEGDIVLPLSSDGEKIICLSKSLLLKSQIIVSHKNDQYSISCPGLNEKTFAIAADGSSFVAGTRHGINIFTPTQTYRELHNKHPLCALALLHILNQKNNDQSCLAKSYQPYIEADLYNKLIKWGILKK